MNPWSPGYAICSERPGRLSRFLTRFAKDESGATAIEYGLIIATIFLVILASVTLFADRATDKFNDATAAIVAAG